MLLCYYFTSMIRTTVRLPEDIFKEARKKAIDERVAFAAIVSQALESYLGKPQIKQPVKYSLKVYSMGKVKADLRRLQIYDNL